MENERLREDAKQLLRVAYDRELARGDVGLGVDLGAAADERGVSHDSPHLETLADYMEVAGWIEADTAARVRRGDRLYRITERGLEVLREVIYKEPGYERKIGTHPNQKSVYLSSATACRVELYASAWRIGAKPDPMDPKYTGSCKQTSENLYSTHPGE
jgi:hypothetical protein